MNVDPRQLNSLALAYIGDAVYELFVRNHLIQLGQVKPQQLHNEAVKYVSGTSQSTIIHEWIDQKRLTAEEEAVVRRGRNAKSHSIPKNVSISAYRYATAFEALMGYHYLMDNKERLHELMNEAINDTNELND
ncbi:Mini-ribonuclease 3 [Pseudogracilibacillus auburnensis]|uniref:Mini-ribonuclease 3 n=1 Tax=Pseudogracilibacillus auburnensis TaxID=1494959 RepID=UPI001A965E2A|nr:Mini-ribonuclease 3 [Pseudogracilibacillus auburnensis]MBO1005161.1 Mini-ribonuclease 3 [Pseudogracilibacillus auburnensis]